MLRGAFQAGEQLRAEGGQPGSRWRLKPGRDATAEVVSEQEQSAWRGPADPGSALAQLIRSRRCQLGSNWLPELHSVLGPSVAFSELGLGLPSSALALFQSLLVLGWSTITNHRPRCPALPLISVHGRQPPSAGISFPEEPEAPQRDQTLGFDLPTTREAPWSCSDTQPGVSNGIRSARFQRQPP